MEEPLMEKLKRKLFDTLNFLDDKLEKVRKSHLFIAMVLAVLAALL